MNSQAGKGTRPGQAPHLTRQPQDSPARATGRHPTETRHGRYPDNPYFSAVLGTRLS
jgi:hypothetical protein